ncbi:MAG TPA: protein kinase [Acidobacteriaceae bacterium]|jgi:serine/threonine-protein kinase
MSSDPKSPTLSRIGRYDVICELGRGGMGIVYRGEDKLIGRDVAIKTLTEVTPELRERFYVEARSGILSHPNIVTVYELGEHEGSPFIAMEFLAGESLDKILRQRGRLPVLETLSIVEQLCAGLGYAHQHGLVHRDVKPANVIVLPDGRSKIVDFGIARLADQDTRLTKTDALVGTFHYIAPERLKGEASDGRADIWSAGVMLYEMVTGELPFKGKDVSALYRVIHESYVPLAEIVQDVPEALSAVLDKALAKDVHKRYATTEEMAFELQPIREGLKRERVQALLETARRLSDERQFAGARTVLLQAQRIDPANPGAKALLQEVQYQLTQLQREEQLRQILEQAEDAVASQQFDDAITYYTQAKKLDEGSSALTERMEQVQALKERFHRVRSLSEQASEARRRGDLTVAQDLLEQALQLDEKNSNLRNAHSIILREIRRQQEGIKIEDLLKSAKEEYSTRKYTEAIARLREAAEIDPTHSEVQQLLITATARQKEERRRVLLDQVVAEIHDCLEGEDFDRAHDRVSRALETLPTETLLLSLKVEIERKKQEFESQQIVRSALLRAQDLLYEQPLSSLAMIDTALKQVPRDESLLQFRSRLEEHLGNLLKEERRAQRLKIAHEAIEARRFEVAIRELESGLAEGEGSEQMESLLARARTKQRQAVEREKKEILWREVQELQRKSEWTEIVTRLEAVNPGSEDAPLAAALEDARRHLREAAERTATLLRRARTLAETDIAAALELVSSQPQEVLANKDVLALHKELTQKAEVARAIDAAVTLCKELLAAGDLSSSMKEFPRVAKTHGESAVLAQAREGCEQERRSVADAKLQNSMSRARDALQGGSEKSAVDELQRPRQIAKFASEAVRAEWEALREEAKGTPTRRAASGPVTVTKKGSRVAAAAVFGVMALGAGLSASVAVWRHRHSSIPNTPSAAAQPQQARVADTYLEVNASPWATVLKIQNGAGKSIDLRSSDHVTPFRLDGVPPASYEVTLKGPGNGQEQVIRCEINAQQHLCTADLGTPDTQQILTGERP